MTPIEKRAVIVWSGITLAVLLLYCVAWLIATVVVN